MLSLTSLFQEKQEKELPWLWLTASFECLFLNRYTKSAYRQYTRQPSASKSDIPNGKRERPTMICFSQGTKSWKRNLRLKYIFVIRIILGRKAQSKTRTEKYEKMFP